MPSDIYMERRYSLKERMIRVCFFIILRYARCWMRKIRVTVWRHVVWRSDVTFHQANPSHKTYTYQIPFFFFLSANWVYAKLWLWDAGKFLPEYIGTCHILGTALIAINFRLLLFFDIWLCTSGLIHACSAAKWVESSSAQPSVFAVCES
jgi:hypothetical protein